MDKIGNFSILRPLATGGMADIFLAKQNGSPSAQLFVIKKIASNVVDQGYLPKLFLRESRLSMSFDHPNLVKTFEVGTSNEDLYLVQEYIDGANLREIFKKFEMDQELFTATMICYLMSEICLGLAYLHGEISISESSSRQACVHRDITPHNIMIGKTGEVKIIDFGIAKSASSESLTAVGSLRGKYAYMSPEQGRGCILTPASDIFSLGIIYYELMTGKRFFANLQEADLIRTLDAWSNEHVETRLNAVWGDSVAILKNMLSADPLKRPTALTLKSIFDTQLKTMSADYGKDEFKDSLSEYFNLNEYSQLSANTTEPVGATQKVIQTTSSDRAHISIPTHLTLYDTLVDNRETTSAKPPLFKVLIAILICGGVYFAKNQSYIIYQANRKPASEAKPSLSEKARTKSILLKFNNLPQEVSSQISVNGRLVSSLELKSGFLAFDGDTLLIKTQTHKNGPWKEHKLIVDSQNPVNHYFEL